VDRVLHTLPATFAPLLRTLSRRQDRPDCWFADIEVSDEQLKGLNLFEASSRHGRVCFALPGTEGLVQGEMNALLGLGPPIGAAAQARVRLSFHDVAAEP
jgi:hypothetical protein